MSLKRPPGRLDLRRSLIVATSLAAVAVLGVAGVVVVRTLTFRPPTAAPIAVAAPTPVDADAAAQHLGQAVRIQTISHDDPAQDQPQAWDDLHDWLKRTYPGAHRVMALDPVGQGVIYTWTGSDPHLPPIVLMAHQDVVPVDPQTADRWRYPAFSGQLAEGAVWGRGSIDDKGSLIALMEAVEGLARRGFQPRRTILIVSGPHEERGEQAGIQAIVARLQARGVHAQFVLDEGMVVIADHPLTHGAVAMIGTAEKGYANLNVSAQGGGGHSSAPPSRTAVGELTRAVQAILAASAPMCFAGPAATGMQTLAPRSAFVTRMALANPWLFRPVLIKAISASPPGAAMLHTTLAPTMLQGSPKANVLPELATARINVRIAPGDSSAAVLARARAALRGIDARVDISDVQEPTGVASTTSLAWREIASTATAVTGAPASPTLVIAATDSRALQPVASDIYRFQPITLRSKDVEMIHGVNEHLVVTDLARMIDFYTRLIRLSAGA
jgi:carboxypeptidase PM20D1